MKLLPLLLTLGCVTPHYSLRAAVEAPVETAPAELTVIQIGPIDTGALLLPSLLLATAPGPVLLVIDSPGGSVAAGLAFEEVMVAAQRRGVLITYFIPRNGYAASMGAYLLQTCDRRVMDRSSTILFHSVSVSQNPGGTAEDVARFAREIADVNKRLAVRIVGHLNITLTEYLEKTKGDWWLGFSEALEVGAIDEVVE